MAALYGFFLIVAFATASRSLVNASNVTNGSLPTNESLSDDGEFSHNPYRPGLDALKYQNSAEAAHFKTGVLSRRKLRFQ